MGPPSKGSLRTGQQPLAPFTDHGSIASSAAVMPYRPPAGLATVTPLTSSALKAIERNSAPNVAAPRPSSVAGASLRTGETLTPFTETASNLAPFRPPASQMPFPGQVPAQRTSSAAAPPPFPTPAPQWPSPSPAFHTQPFASSSSGTQWPQQFAAAGAPAAQFASQQSGWLQPSAGPQWYAAPRSATYIPSSRSGGGEAGAWPQPFPSPAPSYRAQDYRSPETYQRTGWPAAAVPYFDVPYGVPVDSWNDPMKQGVHYGMLPPEPYPPHAAPPSKVAGESVIRPFQPPPNHSVAQGASVSKPPRASERRTQRKRQHDVSRAVDAAAAVGTVAAGVIAVGAIGAMMAL